MNVEAKGRRVWDYWHLGRVGSRARNQRRRECRTETEVEQESRALSLGLRHVPVPARSPSLSPTVRQAD